MPLSTQQFEPMSIGQILDQTFRLYRKNFVRFITIVAVAYVPIGLITAVGQSMTTKGTMSVQTHSTQRGGPIRVYGSTASSEQVVNVNPSKAIAGGLLTIVGAILSLFAYNLCTGALIKSISESYLGNDISVGDAYRFVFGRLGAIIGATILVGFVVGLGFLLLIVPGIIFSLWYALTTQVVVLEKLKASQAMSRSKALASGNLGKIFGVFFVVGLITWIVSAICGTAGGAIIVPFATPQHNMEMFTFMVQLITIVGQVLVMPIATAASILLYYDLRIRKEGFDLEMLSKTLEPGTVNEA
jgi:hypothetical protein